MSPSKTSAVPGWYPAGSHPKSYDMSLFEGACHSGTKCARIHSTKDSVDGFGTLMQSLHAGGYRGQRVKLTAYIKSQDVKEWAGLWMRVDAGKKMVSFDNMQNRPITGDSDWTKYEVVLDVPEESTNISFGVLLSGTGTVWLDDFEFESVPKDVETTTKTPDAYRSCGIQYQNDKPTNLDFSQGLRSENKDSSIDGTPAGWFKQVRGNPTIGVKTASKKGESVAAFIECRDGAHGALLQALLANRYVGKRVKMSADIKTDSVDGTAGLFYRADVGHELSVCYDHMDDRKISGTTGWKNYSCVIDIPEGSDNIYFGGTLDGSGTAWFRSFKLEEVTKKTPTTGEHGALAEKKKNSSPTTAKKFVNSSPVNLTFDATKGSEMPHGWMPSGSHPQKYKMCVDPETVLDGSKCALIQALKDDDTGFGTLMQQVDADSFKGKRVRLSARIKTENAGWAALWMRVDGANREVLGFDNMQHNPIKDTTDWNYYECVLDVPDNSEKVAFGVLLHGGGQAWFSKTSLEEVSHEVQTTDIKSILPEHKKPVNLSFEDG